MSKATTIYWLSMAEAGEPEWTLVAAGHQIEGRGRLGRTWTDVPDAALLFSFVLRPDLPPAKIGLLSLLAGATMAEAIRATTGRRVTCKWPNDLLLRDGSKVGGILLESSVADGVVRYVVVGIGVNLEPPEDQPEAGGIGSTGLCELLEAFITRFARVYTAADVAFPQRVRNAWLPLSATVGQVVRAETVGGREVTGRAVGLDDFGSLLLSTDEGEARIAFGELEHLNS